MLKKALVSIQYPYVRRQCGQSCLGLGLDLVPKQTVFNSLQSIGRKLITYENAFPMKKSALLSKRQVKYVESIIVKRDTKKLGMSSKEAIQVISELCQAKSFVKAEIHLD